MSENSTTSAGGAPPRAIVMEMMIANFKRLPELDQKFFNYGPLYLGGNAAFAGLIANSFFRRALNVTQARIASSVPMAVLPFITTVAFYNAAVSSPLLSGDLNCPSCALMRGALIGVVGGGIYPILLALPVNAGLASAYNSAPMPVKGNAFRFAIDISRPVLTKMRPVLVLQALFGTYLSSRHFDTYKKLVEIVSGSGAEELMD
ncbi:transmembrane protein 126A [Gadus macrocephalus]|uniref:transmembrane protein 126A n=1 Tax=Gadus macrocephalus TaxID=80720 RepID=UPI0028CB5402|nr:transmembrane protein 126A [Gadus macrocephalus]